MQQAGGVRVVSEVTLHLPRGSFPTPPLPEWLSSQRVELKARVECQHVTWGVELLQNRRSLDEDVRDRILIMDMDVILEVDMLCEHQSVRVNEVSIRRGTMLHTVDHGTIHM